MPKQEVKTVKKFTTQLQQEQQSQVMATSHDVGDGTHLLSVKPMEEGKHLQSVFLHGQSCSEKSLHCKC